MNDTDQLRTEESPTVSAPTPTALPEKSEHRAFGRVAGVAIGLAAMVCATYLAPALDALRPWVPGSDYVPFWNVVGREWLDEEKVLQAEAAQIAQLRRQTEAAIAPESAPAPRSSAPLRAEPVFPPYFPHNKIERPHHGIEPPEALDYYFRKLALADLGVPGAIARAGHWGDSILGVDGITSGIRRRLQRRFGDAGHGFHLMDRYNPSYRQQGIEFEAGGQWYRCLVVQECRKQDHRYGYGGLIVHSGGGAASTWSTPRRGFGHTVSSFELWFAHQQEGGDFEIVIDHKEKVTVNSRGPHLQDGWHKVSVQPGSHSFSVRAIGGGNVRAYGVVLENDGPGVVWDGMALIGGSTRGLRTQDPEHIASQIRHRDLDLTVFLFGGNDMQRNYVDLKESMQPYYDEYGDVLKHFRAGKPEAACLIMSVTDHGKRVVGDAIVSVKFGKQLANAQREVARQNGCGFFDTFEAMGGEGTAARWYRASPRLIAPDFGHPNGLGHEVIAGLLANAILHGYEEYRARMEGKPLPQLAPGPSAGTAPQRQDPETKIERGGT
jgi:lysophospholipase L1-like esterase